MPRSPESRPPIEREGQPTRSEKLEHLCRRAWPVLMATGVACVGIYLAGLKDKLTPAEIQEAILGRREVALAAPAPMELEEEGTESASEAEVEAQTEVENELLILAVNQVHEGKGLAAPMNDYLSCPHDEVTVCSDAEHLGVTWVYNWSRFPPVCGDHIRSIPMMYAGFSGCPELGGNVKILLGYNEPDEEGQANLTPEQGAALWLQIEECYPDYFLISPAPAFEPEWLEQMRDAFFELTEGERYPRFDALAAHCYWRGGQSECQEMLEEYYFRYLEEWEIEGGIYLTEYAVFPHWSEDGQIGMIQGMEEFLQWISEEPRIVAHSWFSLWYGTGTDLVECYDRDLTWAGMTYRDFTPAPPPPELTHTTYCPVIFSNVTALPSP